MPKSIVPLQVPDAVNDNEAVTKRQVQRSGIRVTDLPSPFIIPHRGAGEFVAPENTMLAAHIGASYGWGIIDGGDWRMTSDNVLVAGHDPTMDYYTKSTGPYSDLSSMGARKVVTDCSQWFGDCYDDITGLMTAEEFFSAFANKIVISPEPKTQAAANALANMVKQYGCQDSSFVTAFALSYLTPFVDIGCKHVLFNTVTMPTDTEMNSYLAAGVTWIGFPTDQAYTNDANIAIVKAKGFKVMVGTCERATDMLPWQASANAGMVDCWVSNDPVYFAHALDANAATKYRRTKDPFANQAYYHGHIPSKDPGSNPPNRHRGTFLRGNAWGYQVVSASSNASIWNLMGWSAPLLNPTSKTINLQLTFDAKGSVADRWAGFFVCQPTDANYQDAAAATENGYQLWLRTNGQMQMATKNNGVSSQTKTLTTNAISAPLVIQTALNAGQAYTTIAVSALATAVVVGQQFMLPTGQVVTVSAAAAIGATSLTVTSVTPTAAVPSGSVFPQTVPITITITSTTVTFTRTDTNQNVFTADATNRGAYWFYGQADNSGTSGLKTSISHVVIT